MKNLLLAVLFLSVLPFAAAHAVADAQPGAEDEVIYWDDRSAIEKLLDLFPFSPLREAWKINAVPFEAEEGRPLIAIVIDDMGVDRKRSADALTLPPEITMSYLPYARHVREQAEEARAAGHELMVHMPMQPRRRSADPGPGYLGAGMPEDEIRRRVIANLAAFDGYVGVNNHMGSRFTCCAPEGLGVVMRELKSRGLLFLDSKTTGSSIAEKLAAGHGVVTSHRDIFIDDEETDDFTEDALEHIEAHAKRRGTVIAIGHPRARTLKALKAWLPTLEEKGFRLAPLSAVVKRRMEQAEENRKSFALKASFPDETEAQAH